MSFLRAFVSEGGLSGIAMWGIPVGDVVWQLRSTKAGQGKAGQGNTNMLWPCWRWEGPGRDRSPTPKGSSNCFQSRFRMSTARSQRLRKKPLCPSWIRLRVDPSQDVQRLVSWTWARRCRTMAGCVRSPGRSVTNTSSTSRISKDVGFDPLATSSSEPRLRPTLAFAGSYPVSH